MNIIGVNIRRSSPYHPQSQGKDERSHQTWKAKMAFDLQNGNKNWARNLGTYQNLYNNGYHTAIKTTPYKAHFDEQIRRSVFEASKVASEKMTNKHLGKNPPVHYKEGEEVLVRVKGKQFLSKPKVVKCVVVTANREKHMYKVQVLSENSESKTSKTMWVSVRDITSLTHQQEKEKRLDSGEKEKQSDIEDISLSNERLNFDEILALYDMDLQNNAGNGDCMFHALSQQLHRIGIQQTHMQIRQNTVEYLRLHPLVSGPEGSVHFADFVNEPWKLYLQRMVNAGEWGDHVILQAASIIYGIRITVLTTNSVEPTIVSPVVEGNNNLPNIYLGHISEFHYVSLTPKAECTESNREQVLCELCGELDYQAYHFCKVNANCTYDRKESLDTDILYSREKNTLPDTNPQPVHTFQMLPPEVLENIISHVLLENMAMLFVINRVSKLFREIASKYCPKLYIRPSLNVSSGIISVRKLIKLAGKNSGLLNEIRTLFSDRRDWMNAWLDLQCESLGWFILKDIFWK